MDPHRQAMKVLCERIVEKGTKHLTMEDATGKKTTIQLGDSWEEVFPGVEMKAIFPEKKGRTFALKARAGACIDIHQVIPDKFVYVAYGEHKDVVTGTVYKDDENYKVISNARHGMEFSKDSKLIIETQYQ